MQPKSLDRGLEGYVQCTIYNVRRTYVTHQATIGQNEFTMNSTSKSVLRFILKFIFYAFPLLIAHELKLGYSIDPQVT